MSDTVTNLDTIRENVVTVHGHDEEGNPISWEENVWEHTNPQWIMRVERNTLLAETDHWATSDRTMDQEQIDYRQALRDMGDNVDARLDDNGDLTNVTWPVKPGNICKISVII